MILRKENAEETLMWPVQTEFDLRLGLYRQAHYYSLVQRYRLAFLITVPAVLFGIACLIMQVTGVLSFPFPIYIGAACLVWLMLVASRVEKNIRLYLKSPDCLLGRHFKVIFRPDEVKIIVEEKKIYVTHPLSRLAAVFELSSLYMLYLDGQQTYLVSKENLSREQQLLLRDQFAAVLNERFISRFLSVSKKATNA